MSKKVEKERDSRDYVLHIEYPNDWLITSRRMAEVNKVPHEEILELITKILENIASATKEYHDADEFIAKYVLFDKQEDSDGIYYNLNKYSVTLIAMHMFNNGAIFWQLYWLKRLYRDAGIFATELNRTSQQERMVHHCAKKTPNGYAYCSTV